MSQVFDVAVVGGGAAGLAAAISAARRGSRVVVCDRMPRLGKKILATGGGRCNLLPERLEASSFTTTSPSVVASVFGQFGPERILDFFKGLGLRTYSDGSRIFPVTNQAASVLSVLELEVRRLGIAVETNLEARSVGRKSGIFSISAAGSGKKLEARSVVLAGGGRSYPALGSNGSCYELAAIFGHGIITPVPSAVPLIVKDRMCHVLQGRKIRARATGLIGGKPTESADGEILFTQYGLSGTAVLDISESLSAAIHRGGNPDTAVVLDLVPFMTASSLAAELSKRIREGWADSDLVAGILPDRFSSLVSRWLAAEKRHTERAAETLAAALKAKRLPVSGTRGWNEAEFTSGGVDAREVDPRTLESVRRPGLYFAGEILDVQGPRGGYNLAWAWASGIVAGLAGRGPGGNAGVSPTSRRSSE